MRKRWAARANAKGEDPLEDLDDPPPRPPTFRGNVIFLPPQPPPVQPPTYEESISTSSTTTLTQKTSSKSNSSNPPAPKKTKKLVSGKISKFLKFSTCRKTHERDQEQQENIDAEAISNSNTIDSVTSLNSNSSSTTSNNSVLDCGENCNINEDELPKWFANNFEEAFAVKGRKINSDNFLFQCLSVGCKKEIWCSLSSSGNLRRHLKNKHPNLLKEINDRNQQQMQDRQQDLHDIVDHNIKTQKQLDGQILNVCVEGLLPFTFVDLASFKKLVSGLQSDVAAPLKLKVKSRRELVRNLEETADAYRNQLKQKFQDIKYFGATADCWKSLKKAYLGVTLHWLEDEKHPKTGELLGVKRKMAVLACVQITESITYLVITQHLNRIFNEFDIADKVLTVTTDNGSNFVKAFKVFGEKEEVFRIVEQNADSDECEDDLEIIELAPIIQQYSGIDCECDLTLPEHLRCASHTLNLVATTDCDKIVNESPYSVSFQVTFKKCKLLWNRQNSDPIHAAAIQKELGHQLKTPNATRWNSTSDAIECLIHLTKQYQNCSLMDILNKLVTKVNLISGAKFEKSDETFLLEYHQVTRPLAIALDILQRSKEKSELGYFLPVMYSLIRKLESIETNKLNYCGELLKVILNSIKQRFENVLQKETFIIAACLHPKFHFRWISDKEFLRKCQDIFRNLSGQCTCGQKESEARRKEIEEERLAEQEIFDFPTAIQASCQTINNNCILSYISAPISDLKDYPECLRDLFKQYNTPLASSAAVERVFSVCGDILRKKRNLLSSRHFEDSVMLKYALREDPHLDLGHLLKAPPA